MDDFQEIYEKYRDEIFLFILKIVNNQVELAEELTQETFYQTFISLHRFKGICELKTWICQIAKNVCFKYFKKNPIHISIEDKEISRQNIDVSKSSVETLIVEEEMSKYFIKCIQKLKKKYRDVLIYRLYFEMSFNKIGKCMNISENSAKVIFYRGKEMLRESIREYIDVR